MMEAMASGLPCIASRIRGNVDLLENGEGGYLVEVQDVHGIADKIRVLSGDKELREKMKKANLERIKKFDVKVVKKTLEEIYREALG
jgi:glycosyltransferase involved in cell wall biosynthesis